MSDIKPLYFGESGLYWAYVLTEKEILKLRIISRGLFTAAFGIPLILLTILLGPLGGFGAIFLYTLIYVPFRLRAKNVRQHLESMSEEEIGKSDRIAERISYERVTGIRMRSGNDLKLVLTLDKGKAKMKFRYLSGSKLKEFLSSRIGAKLDMISEEV